MNTANGAWGSRHLKHPAGAWAAGRYSQLDLYHRHPIGANPAMTAINDHAVPPTAGQTEPPTQGDALEHWLQDLRTDLTGDPPDWIDTGPAGEPTGREPFPSAAPEQEQTGTTTPAPPIGRHRRPD